MKCIRPSFEYDSKVHSLRHAFSAVLARVSDSPWNQCDVALVKPILGVDDPHTTRAATDANHSVDFSSIHIRSSWIGYSIHVCNSILYTQ